MLSSTDVSWAATWPIIWVGIEANLQIVCASAPTIRKFLRAMLPGLFADSHPPPGGGGTRAAAAGGMRWKGNGSMGLRTFGQAQRPATSRDGPANGLASQSSSHECQEHRDEARTPSRLAQPHRHDADLAVSPASDYGSERAMLSIPSRQSSYDGRVVTRPTWR